MRIILVGKDYYPAIGGMEQHLLELARGLHNFGHSVCVVNLRTSKDLGLPKEQFEQIQEYLPLTKNPMTFFSYTKRLIAILSELNRKQKVDVVHWHDLVSGPGLKMWCKGKNVARIFTNHSSGYVRLRKKYFPKLFFSLSIDHCDAIIAPSTELANYSKHDFKKIFEVVYIPNGVDTHRFHQSDYMNIRKNLDLDQRSQIIFCPRRLSPKNGVSYFAQAIPSIVKQHANSYFLITGRGEPYSEEIKIRKIIDESNMSKYVRFLGNIDNSDMPKWYQASDIVVIPSLIEAVSLSALEAMACSKPVVASNVGGLSQLITNHSTGILVPPANPSAISNAVNHLLSDAVASEKIGANARDHVETNYSWKFIVCRTEQLYQSILLRKGSIV